MKKNIFAVCDLEVDYALNFMDYLNQKKNIPFEIQAFTTVESLIAYGKNIHIELLLISQKAMCRQVQELEIGKIVILSEGVHPPELDRYGKGSNGMLRSRESSDASCFSGIEEDYGDIWDLFPGGALSQDFICADTGTDPGEGEGGFVPEP